MLFAGQELSTAAHICTEELHCGTGAQHQLERPLCTCYSRYLLVIPLGGVAIGCGTAARGRLLLMKFLMRFQMRLIACRVLAGY
jgi:hypothetical protein